MALSGQQQVLSMMPRKSRMSYAGGRLSLSGDQLTARRLMGVLYESFEKPGAYISALGCFSPAAMDTDRTLLTLNALQDLTTEVHKKTEEEEEKLEKTRERNQKKDEN